MSPAKRRAATRPAKATKGTSTGKTKSERVKPGDVYLREGKGTKGAGGDPGGRYWHVEVDGKRVGRVFVNLIDEPPFGEHASIQIYLNKTDQGRGIGSVAYRLACEASGYATVFAHMRKSNLASRRAAEAAGFIAVEHPEVRQLIMVWERE